MLGLLAQACGEAGPTPTPATTSDDGVVNVGHRNYAFDPDRLSFRVGETVEFHLNSEDGTHTFTVRDLDINWAVGRQDEAQVQTYTFDQPGTFRLICAIPGHEGLGMTGTIEVR